MKPYIPNDDPKIISDMLREIGVQSVEDLYRDIPEEMILERNLNLPPAETEDAVQRLMEEKLGSNLIHGDLKIFLGGGTWIHHVPSAVSHLIGRGEFLTSYTPYQPEISQGLLQVLFEYQSLICELTDMEVANCSMYDWGTAAAEAVLMASRVKDRFKILVAGNVSPRRLEIMRTYTEPVNILIEKIPLNAETGGIDINKLGEALDEEVGAFYMENPSYLGSIEDKVEEICDMVHAVGGLYVVGVDPVSLGVIKPPGEYGADIVVGEGQPLGNRSNFGGPLLGIFGCRGDMKVVRQMPGRIIGMTLSQEGDKKAYSMILQTREQHIRRERATSNICTNQALTAAATAIYLSLLGKRGLRNLAEGLAYRAHYAAHRLRCEAALPAPPYEYPYFREVLIKIPEEMPVRSLLAEGLKRGYILGERVEFQFPEYKNSFLASFSDLHTKQHIDGFVDLIKELAEGRTQ